MSVKLHQILVNAITDALNQIFFEDRYADKVIEKILKSNPKWGARDRAFIAENIYEIVRYWRLLAYVSDSEGKERVRLEKIIAVWFYKKGYDISNWNGFKGLDRERIDFLFNEASTILKIQESIPDWLDNLCSSELKSDWATELHAMNRTAEVILRVNTLKTNIETLEKAFENEQISVRRLKDTPNALALLQRKNIFNSEMFKKGFFEVQDAGSQWIAPMLNAEPGMRVIDACAGAGGKTLHLSALMQNKGTIVAMDIENYKLEELRKRAKRAGSSNIDTRIIENSKTIKRLHDSADRVLLDVPCSGLGVLRRNPDAKWKLSLEFIEKIKNTQSDIFDRYSKMLRQNGELVYATCSLLPSESEKQVVAFLEKQNGNYELQEEKRCSPAQHGYDGFYMARLKRIK